MSNGMDNKYKAIFVDFFDTLVFRHVTAREGISRWVICIKKKFPKLSIVPDDELFSLRIETFKELREELLKNSDGRTEVTYEEAIGEIYKRLSKYIVSVDVGSFISVSKNIDLSIEIGCTYANRKLLKEIIAEKEHGRKLYIVSDYYLSVQEIKQIMFSVGIPDDLFDQVFVSCDIGKRKANGDMYSSVLKKIGLEAHEVKMIGDNQKSDYEIPKALGIQDDYRPNFIHKIIIHIENLFKINYAKRQSHIAVNEMYKRGMEYSEYINMFYIFTRRLYAKLVDDQVAFIAFMAREGYYLKDLFELYQSLIIPEEYIIRTSYYWCSRRSVMSGIKSALMPENICEAISVRNWLKSLDISVDEACTFEDFSDEEADEPLRLEDSVVIKRLMKNDRFREKIETTIDENRIAFLKYTENYIEDGVFRFVDSGWKCTTQNALKTGYELNTIGYYIGIQKPEKPICDLKRTGLIFCEENPKSRYYEYLGTNIPFYQQLLAAPHGTALKYQLEDDNVTIKSEWDPMEKKLYHDKIERLQKYMYIKFKGLSVWDDKNAFDCKEDWFLAKSSMRSSLFAHGTRLKFIQECTENYVQNFGQEKKGKVQYDLKRVRIGVDIIWKPEKLVRYFGKVQRTSLYKKRIIRIIYPIMARVLYGYINLLQGVKNLKAV